MTKRYLAFAAVFLILICMPHAVWADTVELKSGRIIEGTIVEETDELVAVETDGKMGFFSKEDIKSINKTRLGVASGKIISLKGLIEILPKGEIEWKAAGKGTPLNEGDKVRSGADSNAVAIFANQLIVAVEKDSAVELEKLQQSRKRGMDVKMKLEQGQLWNDVGKLRNKSSKFYVETPQAVTGVRGTVFTVQITPDARTHVAVVRGTVDVRTRGLMMSPIKIDENTMTEVIENSPPATAVAITEEFLGQWRGYESQFRWLRVQMFGGQFGLSQTQSLITAVAILVVLVVLVIVLFRRRRKRA